METELAANEENKDSSNPKEEEESYTMRKLFCTPDLRMPLFIAVFLQVCHSLLGLAFLYSFVLNSDKIPAMFFYLFQVISRAFNNVFTSF